MRVSVTSPSRLHLGIIDLSGALGRFYGSIGVALYEPRVKLTAEKADEVTVTADRGVEPSIVAVCEWAAEELAARFGTGGIHIYLEKAIPRHVGLGSTTQAVLSVAAAMRELYAIPSSIRELAVALRRGSVSGVGTAVFEHGGFVIDGGVRPGELLPPLIVRYDFPEDWVFVVAVPSVGRGLAEDVEDRVFAQLKGSPDYAREISYLVLMRMLPALVERDIKSFGEALTRIQQLVGASFSSCQGGLFHSDAVARVVNFMRSKGAYGVGQSSWGPTCYGLVEGEEAALELMEEVVKFMRANGYGGRAFISHVRNRGADVERF